MEFCLCEQKQIKPESEPSTQKKKGSFFFSFNLFFLFILLIKKPVIENDSTLMGAIIQAKAMNYEGSI